MFNRSGNNNSALNRSSLNRFNGQNQNQNQGNFNANTNSTNGRDQENEQWIWPMKGGDSGADKKYLRSPVSLRSMVMVMNEESGGGRGENFGNRSIKSDFAVVGNAKDEKGAENHYFCPPKKADDNLNENNSDNFGNGKGSGVVYRRPPFLHQSSAGDDEGQRENLVSSMNDEEEFSPASANIGHNPHPRFSSFHLFPTNNNSQSQTHYAPPPEPLQQRQNQIQQPQPPKKVTFSAAQPKVHNVTLTTPTDKSLPSLLVSGVPPALIPGKEEDDNNKNISSNKNEIAKDLTQKPSSSTEKGERQTPKPPKQKTVAFGLTTNLQETVLKNKPSETSLFGSSLSTRRGPSLLANQELSDLKRLVNVQQTQIAELSARISALLEADERRREEMDVLRARLSTLCELVEELAIGGGNSPTIAGGGEGELSPPALVSDEKMDAAKNEGAVEIVQKRKQQHRSSRREECETARQIQTSKKRAPVFPSTRQHPIVPVVPTLSAAAPASTQITSSSLRGIGIIRGDDRGGKQRLFATATKEEEQTTRHIVRRSIILHQEQSSTDNSRSLIKAPAPIVSTTTTTVHRRRRRTSRSGIFISDDTNSNNKNNFQNQKNGRSGPMVQELSSSSSSSLIDVDGVPPLMNNGRPRGNGNNGNQNVSEGLEQLMASFRHASTESIRSLYDDDEDGF